jgi:hypothetical protein
MTVCLVSTGRGKPVTSTVSEQENKKDAGNVACNEYNNCKIIIN